MLSFLNLSYKTQISSFNGYMLSIPLKVTYFQMSNSSSEYSSTEEQVDGTIKNMFTLKTECDKLAKENTLIQHRLEQYSNLKQEISEYVDSNGVPYSSSNPRPTKNANFVTHSKNIEDLDLDDFEVRVPNYLYIEAK